MIFLKDTENLTDKNKGWTKFVFYQKGVKNNENCLKCPQTTKIIEQNYQCYNEYIWTN